MCTAFRTIVKISLVIVRQLVIVPVVIHVKRFIILMVVIKVFVILHLFTSFINKLL